jgi:signal transduction histidine kinase
MARAGIEVDYRQDGELPVIKGDAAIHVYRILQEALNNVARHSQASKVRVCVVSDGGDLRLEVEDHGVGLPAADHQNGLGLIAMRERAELLGGRLALLRPPAGGTLVSLEVPIGEEDSRSSARLAKASQ